MQFLFSIGLKPSDTAAAEAALADGQTVGRVVEQQRGLLRLRGTGPYGDGEWWAQPSGRLHATADADAWPVAGDWVTAGAGGTGARLQIHAVWPRHTVLSRQAAGEAAAVQVLAANVDHILVVTSLNQELNLRRLERYRVLIDHCGVPGTLVLSKADLVPDVEARERLAAQVADILPTVVLSTQDGTGVAALVERLRPGETHVIVGSSGVGKSTLVNVLLGGDVQDTAGIRPHDSRGRHTTTSRSLFMLPGGELVIVISCDVPWVMVPHPDRQTTANETATAVPNDNFIV